MPELGLSVHQVLTTTRAVRKRLDFDLPVELAQVRACLEIALQAPSGSNAQGWHFVLVTDAARKKAIGELYARAFDAYRSMPISAHSLADEADGERARQMERVVDSAEFLAKNMHRAPMLLIPCLSGRIDVAAAGGSTIAAGFFGSILPAFWSFMLAARARGIGTAWTTLHLIFERDAAAALGIPYDTVTQAGLTPIAYTRGTEFKPAARKPLDAVLHVDAW